MFRCIIKREMQQKNDSNCCLQMRPFNKMAVSSCLAIVSIVHCSPSPPSDLALPIERNWSCRTEGECCFVGSVISARSGHPKCVN